MAVGGGLGQHAEGGAAVRPGGEQPAAARLLPEQGEGKLIARIEQRDAGFAFAAALGDAAHFVGIGGTFRRDRLEPLLRLGKGLVADKPRRRETGQIGLEIIRDFPRKAAAVRQSAGIGIAFNSQQRNGGHLL